MKNRTILLFVAAGFIIGPAAYAQRRDSISSLMRYENIGAPEAASVIAIARGLNLGTETVMRYKKEFRAQAVDLASALLLSERLNRNPREIWSLRNRGVRWDEIERTRGAYDDRNRNPRGGTYDPRYDDRNRPRRTERGGDPYDDIFRDRDGRRSDPYGRNDPYQRSDPRNPYQRYDPRDTSQRDRYGRTSDEEFERNVWETMLSRTYGSEAGQTWPWLREKLLNPGDLALGGHAANVARANVHDVLYEYSRSRSWSKVRELFGISRDWERLERRGRYDRNPRQWDNLEQGLRDYLGDLFRKDRR